MAPEKGCIAFNPKTIIVGFSSHPSDYRDDVLIVEITYAKLGKQLSTLKLVFTSSLRPVSASKDLYIIEWKNFRHSPTNRFLHSGHNMGHKLLA